MQRIGVSVCANIVAKSECVWTIAPQAKARYSSRCGGGADGGRHLLSDGSPVSTETNTILSGLGPWGGTPLGLLAKTPASRSAIDSFPNVPMTRPVDASSRLARQHRSLRVIPDP